jgi:hypothetical protein
MSMDRETLAMVEIARRAKTVRVAASVPILVAGIALGVAGYLALRGLLFAPIGAHSPYVAGVLSMLPATTTTSTLAAACVLGVLTMLPAMTIAWKLAVVAGRALVRQHTPSWVDEMSRAHGIPRETLAQFARIV